MALQELTETRMLRLQREYRQRLFRRRIAMVGIPLLAALLAFVVYRAYAAGALSRQALPLPRPESEVQVTFGFDRQPVVRNFALDVEPAPDSEEVIAEDALGVRLASDLRHETRSGEFPADQLTVGLTRLSTDRVNLTITVNPWEPERVDSGTYVGEIQIRGASIAPRDIVVAVALQDRENRAAVLALSLLVAGSLLGLLVKWITERLTPQAHMARRLAGLKAMIAYQEDLETVPVAVRLRVRDLEDQIARQEYAAVEGNFKWFEERKVLLAQISSQVRLLLRQFLDQRSMVDSAGEKSDPFLLKAVIDSEYRVLQQLLAERQVDDVDGLAGFFGDAQATSLDVGTITNLIDDFLKTSSPALRQALLAIRAGNMSGGILQYVRWVEAGGASSEDVAKGERAYSRAPTKSSDGPRVFDVMGPEGREATRLGFLFRNARAIAGLASVVVVSLVGLKLQYLDSAVFSGGLTSWLGLALWGAVVELSGVSVLEVVGRLGTSAGGSAGASRAA